MGHGIAGSAVRNRERFLVWRFPPKTQQNTKTCVKCSIENDVYAVLGCLLYAVHGSGIFETHLDKVSPKWESSSWSEYTNIIREWRPQVITTERLQEVVDASLCNKDANLRLIISQLAIPRQERMNLEEIAELVRIHEASSQE